MELRRDPRLQLAHPSRRNDALHQTAKHAAHADIHVQHPQHLMIAFLADFESDVGDAHHFAALRVDNLLIQQIARPRAAYIRRNGAA